MAMNWFKNEKRVIKKLGLEPVPGSGSGWIHKEDGENEFSIAQLKSTKAESFKLNLLDIKKLEYHANNSNKVPLFFIEFVKENSIFLVLNVNNISELRNKIFKFDEVIADSKIKIEIEKIAPKKIIKVSSNKQFYKERNEQYVSTRASSKVKGSRHI